MDIQKIMKKSIYKAKGGLIRIKIKGEDKIEKIVITGDFFFYPENELENLEKYLIGTKISEEEVYKSIKKFYKEKNIESPGLNPEDLTKAIILTK